MTATRIDSILSFSRSPLQEPTIVRLPKQSRTELDTKLQAPSLSVLFTTEGFRMVAHEAKAIRSRVKANLDKVNEDTINPSTCRSPTYTRDT